MTITRKLGIVRTLLTILSFLAILFTVASTIEEDDIQCIEGIRAAVKDPNEILKGWNHADICRLYGVTCWNLKEDRIMGLKLTNMSLEGSIPSSIKFCQSLQTLDLSSNSFSGGIPTEICTWLPYLTSIDLSKNQLSGSIPRELSNCSYLHKLNLSSNMLSGPIPEEILRLERLEIFSVANNRLSGKIPHGLSTRDACKGSCGMSNTALAIIVAAGTFGFACFVLFAVAVSWCYHRSRRN